MLRSLLFLVPLCFTAVVLAADPPQRVTIVGDAIPLEQALNDLTKQTSAPIVNSLPRDEKLSRKLDLRNVAFGEALDRIALAANAEVDLYRLETRIELLRRGRPPQLPISYSGPFRVAMRKLSPVLDFANQKRSLTVDMEVAWDPSVEPFSLQTRPQQITLQKEQ